MSTNVWDRYQDVLAELAEDEPHEDLEAVLDAEEALAATAARRGRPRRVLAAVLVLLVLGGAGAGGWLLLDDRADPTPVDVMLAAGLAAQQQGEALTAKGIYLQVLERDPNNPTALFDLGVLAQASGDLDEALVRYRAASKADAHLADALFNEATILAARDRQAAVDRYRRVLALQPANAAAHLNLGLVLAELGSLTDARVELRAAVGLDASMRSRVPAVYRGLLPKT